LKMQSETDYATVTLSTMQKKAIESDARAVVVLASAGSGKTEVVARRVQRILGAPEGVGRVLALSYTNKAAEELRDRLRERTGSESDRVMTETIHGFAHSLVRQHSTRIGLPLEPEVLTRDEDRVELLDQWRESQGLGRASDPLGTLRRMDLDRAKNVDSEDIADWRRALASLPALDYPALLDAAFELLELKSVRRQLARTYTHIVVDEAQNLTPAQYRLLTQLVGPPGDGPSAMLVGDDKQSIISFAGADPELIKKFAKSYDAQVIELTQNFRSAAMLSELAGIVANELGQHQGRPNPHAARGQIDLIRGLDEEDEAREVTDWIQNLLRHGLPAAAVAVGESVKIRPEDVAVLGRSASALRATAIELDKRSVEYSSSSDAGDWLEGLVGKIVLEIIALNASVQHFSPQWQLARLIDANPDLLKTPEEVASVISLHRDPLVVALAPLIGEPDLGRFITKLQSLSLEESSRDADLASWTADLEEINHAWADYNATVDRPAQSWPDFRIFCSRRQRGSSTQGLQLLTIHKSQGREFRAVAIVGMNEGQIPDFRAKTATEQASELRTFYVAITRARRILLLSRARQRSTRFGVRGTTASPYLSFAKKLQSGTE
jgi:DNA helicase-2/ATP-dependent DNA helicase PcrA